MTERLPRFEQSDRSPDIAVQESEYKRLLGFPEGHELRGRSRELADWAAGWYAQNGRPWIYAISLDGVAVEGEEIRVNGNVFTSAVLRERFSSADVGRAVLVAVSAGPECEAATERLWREGKPDEYFFLEMYGSAVVEHLVAVASGRLCAWADRHGLAVLPHYSPGYPGWDISQQAALWALAGGNIPGRIEVLPSGMLRPRKSLIALFGLARAGEPGALSPSMIPCEGCALPGCNYRRAAYRRGLPQAESGAAFTPGGQRALQGGGEGKTPAPRYSVNLRALRKWSAERLRLKWLEQDWVEATFRYEGTTCSNMGRPLVFEYRVTLGPDSDGRRILSAECVPAPGDDGHRFMCEYLRRGDELIREIAGESPLLNEPLGAVLDWKRAPSPAGCYCDSASRLHKWGLVLEVIHFALTERSAGAGRNGKELS